MYNDTLYVLAGNVDSSGAIMCKGLRDTAPFTTVAGHVRREGPGSGFESLSGAGAGWKSRILPP